MTKWQTKEQTKAWRTFLQHFSAGMGGKGRNLLHRWNGCASTAVNTKRRRTSNFMYGNSRGKRGKKQADRT